MPKLVKKLSSADFRRRSTSATRVDLAPYLEILSGLAEGDGAEVQLDPNELQRVVKRRFSMAATQHGFAMKWRTAPDGHLRFQLMAKDSRR
ncbi:MAG: hypothetical protein M1118_09505 [Chloroflexi bacterium]|nr:hypothetical protein [Chloroflexota bacterium]